MEISINLPYYYYYICVCVFVYKLWHGIIHNVKISFYLCGSGSNALWMFKTNKIVMEGVANSVNAALGYTPASAFLSGRWSAELQTNRHLFTSVQLASL